MIKKFESFDKSEKNTSEIISNLNLLYNYSVVRQSEVNEILPMIFSGVSEIVVNWLEDQSTIYATSPPNFNLSNQEKLQIVNTYDKLYDMYHLDKLPNIDDINDIFVPLRHLTDIEITIQLSRFVGVPKVIFEVNTVPKIKYFPNQDQFYIDIDSYDEIVMEIKPAIDKIKSIGFVVETMLAKFGKIKIIVSK